MRQTRRESLFSTQKILKSLGACTAPNPGVRGSSLRSLPARRVYAPASSLYRRYIVATLLVVVPSLRSGIMLNNV